MISCFQYDDMSDTYEFSLENKEEFKKHLIHFGHNPNISVVELDIHNIVPKDGDKFYIWEIKDNEFGYRGWDGTFEDLKAELLIMDLAGL